MELKTFKAQIENARCWNLIDKSTEEFVVQAFEKMEKELHVANQKLNSIRCYMEMPVPRNELEPAILAVLDDPEHDGI